MTVASDAPSERLSDHAARIVAVDLGGVRFDIEIHAGVDRYISAEIARDHVWEPFETSVVTALCRPGDLVVDIGANIGWYSLLASRCVGASGVVIAAEPDPNNFVLLERNLARNSATNVDAHQVAVGAESGSALFFLSEENMGDHRMFDGGEGRRSFEVPVTTLEMLLKDADRPPSLIKSDTQGSEWSIVRGAGESLPRRTNCAWLLEFWPHGLEGMHADPGRLLGWFDAHGFMFFELSEGYPRLVRTTPSALLDRVRSDLSAASGRFINLLLLHPDDSRQAALRSFFG